MLGCYGVMRNISFSDLHSYMFSLRGSCDVTVFIVTCQLLHCQQYDFKVFSATIKIPQCTHTGPSLPVKLVDRQFTHVHSLQITTLFCKFCLTFVY
jgi:hypothetical protein